MAFSNDQPVICYDNLIDAYAIVQGFPSSAGLLSDAWNNDTRRPGFIQTDGGGGFRFDVRTQTACDTFILGANRHMIAGERFSGGLLQIFAKTAATTMTLIYQGLISAAVNESEIVGLSAHTPYAPTSWADVATGITTGRRARWVYNRFYVTTATGVLQSTDGNTWSTITIDATAATITDITYSPSLGLYVASGDGGRILTSVDLLTWTARTSGVANQIEAVFWDGTQFVFVTTGGEVSTSADGITWIARTSPLAGTALHCVYSSTEGAAGLVVGGAAGAVMVSPDGVTWTASSTGSTGNVQDIVLHGSEYFAAHNNGDITVSSDGINWQMAYQGGAGTAFYGIDSDGQSVRAAGVGVVSSADGVTWNTLPGTADTVFGLATNNVVWVAQRGTITSTINYAPVYSISVSSLSISSDVPLPEVWLGNALVMPYIDYGFDPYVEFVKNPGFQSENGRTYESVRFRRVELNPHWSVVPDSLWASVDLFREQSFETRTPFWWAWKPLSSPLEVYLMKHKPNTLPMPYKSAVHRSFNLPMVEAV